MSSSPEANRPSSALMLYGALTRWNSRWEHWYRRALPTYVVALYMSTHLPRLDISRAVIHSDRALHVIAFALLAFLFWKFCEAIHRPVSAWFIAWALPLLLTYAAFDECTQQFFDRSVDVWDWLADASGICAVMGALEIIRRVSRTRRQNAASANSPQFADRR